MYLIISDSSCIVCQYCGPQRPFAMSITDNNGRELIHLERPLHGVVHGVVSVVCKNWKYRTSYRICKTRVRMTVCVHMCMYMCVYMHVCIDVNISIHVCVCLLYSYAFVYPEFTITNESQESVLKIKGPCCTSQCCSDVELFVSPKTVTKSSSDRAHEVGKISKQWSGLVKRIFH